MQRSLLLCLLISVLAMNAGLLAAAESDLISRADALAAAGKYDDAITDYKRFICFNRDDERASLVQVKIAKAYWGLGDREKALDEYGRAVDSAPSDQIRDARRVDLAVLHLANKDYSSAEAVLLRVSAFSADADAKRRASFFLAVCHLYLGGWDEARDELKTYFEGRDDPGLARLYALLSPANRPRLKSSRLARSLSTILPGSGQIYAGRIGDGINAICVNGLFGMPLFQSLRAGRVLDIMMDSTGFLRYYNGNRDNAGNQVDRYNDQLNRRYAEQVIELLKTVAH